MPFLGQSIQFQTEFQPICSRCICFFDDLRTRKKKPGSCKRLKNKNEDSNKIIKRVSFFNRHIRVKDNISLKDYIANLRKKEIIFPSVLNHPPYCTSPTLLPIRNRNYRFLISMTKIYRMQ